MVIYDRGFLRLLENLLSCRHTRSVYLRRQRIYILPLIIIVIGEIMALRDNYLRKIRCVNVINRMRVIAHVSSQVDARPHVMVRLLLEIGIL